MSLTCTSNTAFLEYVLSPHIIYSSFTLWPLFHLHFELFLQYYCILLRVIVEYILKCYVRIFSNHFKFTNLFNNDTNKWNFNWIITELDQGKFNKISRIIIISHISLHTRSLLLWYFCYILSTSLFSLSLSPCLS